METKDLIPFDLAKCIAGEPVVTRDGRPYKFGAYNPDAEDYELIGWIDNQSWCHVKSGNCYKGCGESNFDLFMAPKEEWRNVYVDRERMGEFIIGYRKFKSKEEAEQWATGDTGNTYVMTIKIPQR